MSSSSEQHFAQCREVFESNEHGGPVEIEGIEDPKGLRPENSEDLVYVDAFTGSSRALIPLYLSEGRGGFGPDLKLEYDSRRANGVFGVGWDVDVPSIGRKTSRQAPLYDDHEDPFEIGSDELVPGLRVSGGYIEDRFEVGEYAVIRYRRRHEKQFERVERWLHQPSGQTHWRTVDAHNVTSLYGINPDGRISDPTDSTRIARWLLNERFDDRGNVVRYIYKAENLDGVDLNHSSEAHRRDRVDACGGARYLKRVLYANAAPHDRGPWHFEIVFDYGDHDDEHPTPVESKTWAVRSDAFSDNRFGFEIRTWRRCHRILMFHRFSELGTEPRVVSATEFAYDNSRSRTVLTSTTHTGYTWRERNDVERRSLPTLSFSYTGATELATFELDAPDVIASLANDAAMARWTDFYTEGLPGVLSRDGDQWRFVRNLGGVRFAAPEVVPYEDPLPVVDLTETALAHERSYQPLLTSRARGGRDGQHNNQHDDQHIGYIDLNGDFADDVVVANDEIIRWYPSQGEEGFGDPVILRLGDAERVRPQRLSQDDKQSFHVADITGDGLLDLIRVRDGEVCYWPGLGRGRFGERIVMDTPPVIGAGADSVVFADLTGNGAVDLLLLSDGKIRFWHNSGGRCFADVQTISAPGATTGGHAAAVDLFGRGFDSVVWVDRSGDEPTVRYLAPVGDQTAELLASVDNGRGAVARVSYASSTDLWRRDRDTGQEWVFTSPVPVHVVERLEVRDSLTLTRLMRRYVFRHAAYEGEEGSFIGFAASEIWQGGLAEDYALPGLFPDDDVLDVTENRRAPFLVTKRWFHTGTMVDGGDLTEELIGEFHTDEVSGRHRWLSGHQMPLGQKARDVTDAHKVLRGWLLREELVAGVGGVPLRVSETTAWVRQMQPGRADNVACFDAQTNESINVVYDTKGSDPQVQHKMTLAADDLGVVTRSAEVSYRRREPDVEAQGYDRVIVRDTVVSHSADQSTWYRIGVPMQETEWAFSEIKRSTSQLLDPRDLRNAFESDAKAMVSKKRHRYWSNDCSQVLEIGRIESRALLCRVEQLALDNVKVHDLVTDESVDELLRFEGGYERDDDGWWSPGTTQSYDASRFYVVSSTRTALGHERKLRYDNAMLTVLESEDAFGNVTRTEMHPRTLKWWRKVDPNGNVIIRRFDPAGNVLSVAAIGKPGDGSGDIVANDTIEASSGDDPTAVQTYRLDSWRRDNKPTWVRTRHRDRHGRPSVRVFERVSIYDAFGRLIGISSRAGDDRWLTTDLVERDALGRVVRQAVPFFSDEILGDDVEREDALRRGRLITRGALGEVIRVDHPDGTVTMSNSGPWSSTFHDANDKVLDSEWYASRQGSSQGRAGDFGSRRSSRHVFEARAAVQAALHAQTPTTELFDPLGNVVAVRRSLTPTEHIEHRYERDIRGNITQVFDAAGRSAEQTSFDLLSRTIRVDIFDAGSKSFVRSASGELLRHHHADGSSTRYRYDAAGSLTHVFVSNREGEEHLIERIVWGGGETNVPDVADHNLVSKPHMRLHAGGLEVLEECDLHGNPVKRVLYPTTAQTAEPDWSSVSELVHAGQMIPILTTIDHPLVPRNGRRFEARYDALSRPARLVGPDGIAIHYQYGAQGRVQLIAARRGDGEPVPVARDLRYTATGHFASGLLGKVLRMSHRRDAAGRLAEILAANKSKDTTVQDHQLVYDPVGNVISVTDRTELVASYSYDGIDRLVKAEGFEPGGEGNAFRRYTNTYTLDTHDNITHVAHVAPAAEWERSYTYEEASNKLRASSRPNSDLANMAASYDYDASGNLIKGANGESYTWSHAGHLISASVNGSSVVCAYDSDGMLRRRIALHSDDIVEETIVWNGFELVRRSRAGKIIFERSSTTVHVENRPIAVLEVHGESALELRAQVTDHIGSVIAELNGEGDPITEEEFLPFGVPWYRKAREDEDLLTKRFSFRGGRFDEDLVLLFVGDRVYSPWIGRYISPSGAPSHSPNPYVIEGANPQRY